MKILTPTNWQDYQLLDSGDGKRLERFGKYILVRPDPQIIWRPSLPSSEWQKADAVFDTSTSLSTSKVPTKGAWKKGKNVPDNWQIAYQDLKFLIKLSPFKHTGIFPEQAAHWGWMESVIQYASKPVESVNTKNTGVQAYRPTDKEINILNLFGYTGAASLVAAKAGAKVTHIDASYPTIGWARENSDLSGLSEKPIRWILDDAIKFCERELKRGVKYDGIIMDPPIYGHGPKGEIWDFNKSFPDLMELCRQLLSNIPLFFIVNAYAISTSSITLENVLKDYLKNIGGEFESGELALQEKSGRLLSTGIFARWSKKNIINPHERESRNKRHKWSPTRFKINS